MYTIEEIRRQLQKFHIADHYIEAILKDLLETNKKETNEQSNIRSGDDIG
jgi:predicted metal-dependent hydrolase